MDFHDDPLAKHRARAAEIKAQVEREEAEERAAASDAASAVTEGNDGTVAWIATLTGVVVLGLSILGLGITFVRLSGNDFADARGAGWAAVERCDRNGPITNQGFGYWESCRFTVRWEDGTANTLVSDGLFRSDDIGHDVRIGYLGERGRGVELARQDTPARPWFQWIGIAVGLIGGLPLIVVGLIVSLSLRRR